MKIQELESEIADLRNKIESQNYLIEKLINESMSENQETEDNLENLKHLAEEKHMQVI